MTYKEAHQLLGDLGTLNSKNTFAKAKVNFKIDSTGRKTKKLLDLIDLSVGYPGVNLVRDFSIAMGPKQCYGLLGHNGSGKTTFLKTLNGELKPTAGTVKAADDLKIVYFEQKRTDLPMDESLVEYLGNGSDYVIFKDSSIHVASYASKFLFTSDRLHVPIGKLSGGEQARLLLAKILLKPADVLILDEPTNDLDIMTISILEDIIINFEGLVLLVSHDRAFLSSICTHYLALDGEGSATFYADVTQWLKATRGSKKKETKCSTIKDVKIDTAPKKSVKLSYKDKRFLEDAENIILKEEEKLSFMNKNLEDAINLGDSKKIQELSISTSQKQNEIEKLYERWDSLNNT